MSRGMDPNWLKMQQEVMRHNGLKGAKNTAPGGKRDLKFLLIILGVIAAIIVLLECVCVCACTHSVVPSSLQPHEL